ncbi:hypothetical protein ONZ45_g6150 [Pleurotus djamor]|nr:hypothetical protein ONZ45_g6150 [Pleurotus djamor]
MNQRNLLRRETQPRNPKRSPLSLQLSTPTVSCAQPATSTPIPVATSSSANHNVHTSSQQQGRQGVGDHPLNLDAHDDSANLPKYSNKRNRLK